MNQLKVTSVALTPDQIKFTRGKGNTSRFIRSLIDREIGNEQATERCQSLVRAYQNVLKIPQGGVKWSNEATEPD